MLEIFYLINVKKLFDIMCVYLWFLIILFLGKILGNGVLYWIMFKVFLIFNGLLLYWLFWWLKL